MKSKKLGHVRNDDSGYPKVMRGEGRRNLNSQFFLRMEGTLGTFSISAKRRMASRITWIIPSPSLSCKEVMR